MIVLHHLENSRSQRILWLLEELGVNYEIRRYERDPKTGLAPPELLSIHSLGKSPVITDGEITVAESGAIVEYLVDKYDDGKLRPPAGTPERRAYTYWLHYAEGTFMPFMVLSLILRRIDNAPMPFFARPAAKRITAGVRANYLDRNIRRNLEFMEEALETSIWFVGDSLTAADIQMGFPLECAEVRTDLRHEYPKLADFLARMRQRPAYQAALGKGGPYNLKSD